MIQVRLDRPIRRRDLGTYLASRWAVRRRLDAYVVGGRWFGAIVRPSRRGVSVLPTVLHPALIALCVLGPGLLLWALMWRHEAQRVASDVADTLRRDLAG